MQRRESFDLNYVILVAVVSLLLGVAISNYCVSGARPVDNPTVFRQDLNSVEMIIQPGAPLDPEAIRAIHHFQELPFGDKPATVGMILAKKIEKILCFSLVLVFFYCYFKFC